MDSLKHGVSAFGLGASPSKMLGAPPIYARGVPQCSPVEIRSNTNGRHYWCQGRAGIRRREGEHGEMSAPLSLALAPSSPSAGSRTSCSCRVLRRQWPGTRKPAPPAVNRFRHPRIDDAVKRSSAGLAWPQGRGPSSHTDPGAGNSCCTNGERTPGMSLRNGGGPSMLEPETKDLPTRAAEDAQPSGACIRAPRCWPTTPTARCTRTRLQTGAVDVSGLRHPYRPQAPNVGEALFPLFGTGLVLGSQWPAGRW